VEASAMRLKTTITLEFEGEPRSVLIAALTGGIGELQRGIRYRATANGSNGIKQGSLKIDHSTPEVS